MSFLSPVHALVVIKGFTATEIAREDFGFASDVIFNVFLAHGVVTCLVHREIVIFNRVLRLNLAGGHECFLVGLTQRLAVLVPDDVPAFDLLVDGRVVDQSPMHLDARFVVSHSLLLL